MSGPSTLKNSTQQTRYQARNNSNTIQQYPEYKAMIPQLVKSLGEGAYSRWDTLD
jgi:hypothetical protein